MMTKKESTHNNQRRSIRLKGYDYSQPGAYFVTICTRNRIPLFGQVLEGAMQLSAFGEIVQETWEDLPNHYPHVERDAWVIMPNHVHGVIILTGPVSDRADVRSASTRTAPVHRHGLPEIVRALKSFSARRINQRRRITGVSVWQRNYYEHVVRSERALNAIRTYINENPLRWELDRYNPAAVGRDPQAAALWRLLQER